MTFAHIPAARIRMMTRHQLVDTIVLATMEEARRDGFPVDIIPGLAARALQALARLLSMGLSDASLRRIALRNWKELEE